MPFRIPQTYDSLAVGNADPGPVNVAQYIAWLEKEIATARTYLEAVTPTGPSPIRNAPKKKAEPPVDAAPD